MRRARSSKSLAKLHRPRLHAPIARKRLFRILDGARREQPFIWVAGPPGAGKTTLIGSYLEARHSPYLWYQIDSGDSDPATLFFYLGELVKSVSAKKPLPYFTAEYLPDLAGFARRYFRELFCRLTKGSVLVFDNCHNAATPVFQCILREAIGEIPEGINVIAISRSRAPSEFVRQHANQMLYELGWEQLRLTQHEANSIARRRGLSPSATHGARVRGSTPTPTSARQPRQPRSTAPATAAPTSRSSTCSTRSARSTTSTATSPT